MTGGGDTDTIKLLLLAVMNVFPVTGGGDTDTIKLLLLY